jgi:uroporphyrinogen decarboxylase
MVADNVAGYIGQTLAEEHFIELFFPRMARLVSPALEHGKLLLYHTRGRIEPLLQRLYEIGFNALHPVEPEFNDLQELKSRWAGRLAFIGNLPSDLMVRGTEEEIFAAVREASTRLAPGGGYVLGSAAGITPEVPPENLMIIHRAVQQYGRYSNLGQENRNLNQIHS